jgi:hypothetical protein
VAELGICNDGLRTRSNQRPYRRRDSAGPGSVEHLAWAIPAKFVAKIGAHSFFHA